MNDLDPQLLRLREVEVRLAFAERMIRDQEAIVRRLTDQGFEALLAHELLANLRQAFEVLVRRRELVLATMRATETPLPRGFDPN